MLSESIQARISNSCFMDDNFSSTCLDGLQVELSLLKVWMEHQVISHISIFKIKILGIANEKAPAECSLTFHQNYVELLQFQKQSEYSSVSSWQSLNAVNRLDSSFIEKHEKRDFLKWLHLCR